MTVCASVLWVALALLAWVYLGYPLTLCLLKWAGVGRPAQTGPLEPPVTLIISAYNEAQVIEAKLLNCRELDYPSDRLEILLVSDASNDGTDDLIRRAGPPFRLLAMATRGGKTLGLNTALAQASGDLVVFSDANALYQPDAVRQLVRYFADPEVGAVTGESRYVLGSNDASTVSETTYWSYELWIKGLESHLGSLVGGDGAIYAIRRDLYRELAPGDLSDFVNPLQIVAQGYRNVYAPEAISWEGGAESYNAEFRRKVRIVNRAWRGTFKMRQLLNPLRSGYFACQLLSHKVLRWLVPFWLLLALTANGALVALAPPAAPVYGVLLAGQLLFYALALLGWLAASRPPSALGRLGPVLSVPYYFCLVNLASGVALVEIFRGKEYRTWASSRQVPAPLSAPPA